MASKSKDLTFAYQNHFFHRTAVSIATYPAYFEQLSIELSQDSKEDVPQVMLLTGAKGCGRKKFMTRLAQEMGVERINIIDCGLFNTETRLWERIYKDCKDDTSKQAKTVDKVGKEQRTEKSEITESVQEDEKMRELFAICLQNNKTMLYLDNIQIFCERRQTFLYSFLDNLLLIRTKLWLVFGTTDLFFHDKLEKRVKSRFNFLNLVFEFSGTCPHRFVVDFAKEGKRLPYIEHFASWLAAPHAKQLIFRIAQFCFDLGALLRFIHAAICCAPSEAFVSALCSPSTSLRVMMSGRDQEFKSGEAFFVRCLDQAYASLFCFDSGPLIASLPDLHRLILVIVADECNVTANQYSISMLRVIEGVRRQKNSHAYTQDAMLFAVEELVAQDMLGILEGCVSSSSKVIFRLDHEALGVLRAGKQHS